MSMTVMRVISAGFGEVLGEIRTRFALAPEDIFASNKRPAPLARGLLYVRMTEKGWSTGRIAVLVQRDVSSVQSTIARYHQGVIARAAKPEVKRHWLGGPGPYVDGLLQAFWALADDEL